MKTWIYLTRRDKKGIRILSVFPDGNQKPIRFNVNFIKSNDDLKTKLNDVIYENRMMWEPWIESTKDFLELKQKLRNRGYKNLPFNEKTEVNNENNFSIKTSVENKTMLRKKII